MVTQEVKIGDKVYIVRELFATENDELMDMDMKKPSAVLRARIQKCCQMSDDDYKTLTVSGQTKLIAAVIKVNGIESSEAEE